MRFLLGGKYFTLPTLVRRAAFRVKFGNSLKTAVGKQFGLFMQEMSAAASFEHFEIVLTPFAVSYTYDACAAVLNKHLTFMGVLLLLT